MKMMMDIPGSEFSVLYYNDIWDCIECYLNLPDSNQPDQNPLNYAHIREQQQQDDKLLALQVKYPDNYVYMDLDDNVDDTICYLLIRQKNPHHRVYFRNVGHYR